MHTILTILLILLGIYLLFGLGVTIYLLRPLRRNEEQLSEEELGIKEVDSRLYNIPYDDLWLRSDKGYKLYGRFYKAESSHKYVVILHGHNAASSGTVRFMKIFRDRGYNVILPDHRYSARSGGRSITYGYEEKYDAIKFIDYIIEQDKKAEIGIMGESMGGATAILVSGLRDDLKFCIDLCGYSDLEITLREAIIRLLKPAIIFFPVIKLFFRVIGGFSMSSVCPKESAKNIKFPVLILHSKGDRTVPYHHHKAIADNLTDYEHIAFEASEHGLCLNTYPEEFTKGINQFLDRIHF